DRRPLRRSDPAAVDAHVTGNFRGAQSSARRFLSPAARLLGQTRLGAQRRRLSNAEPEGRCTTSDRISELLKGAIDLHCHSGPSVMPRRLHHVDAIKEGEAAGLRAILFKDHYYSVTPVAALLDEVMPGKVKLLTGVPCNN